MYCPNVYIVFVAFWIESFTFMSFLFCYGSFYCLAPKLLPKSPFPGIIIFRGLDFLSVQQSASKLDPSCHVNTETQICSLPGRVAGL